MEHTNLGMIRLMSLELISQSRMASDSNNGRMVKILEPGMSVILYELRKTEVCHKILTTLGE